MELVFIRHGQGEHTLDLPETLHMGNPSLTLQGKLQAQTLKSTLPLTPQDALIVSPTLRTLQTAFIWSENTSCDKWIYPLVAPRIFPARRSAKTLPCDELIDQETLQREFPSFIPVFNLAPSLWSAGINLLPEEEFSLLAEEFIDFCRSLQRKRIYIVTHDGTITSYRQKISAQKLTREDFLEETEWFRLIVE